MFHLNKHYFAYYFGNLDIKVCNAVYVTFRLATEIANFDGKVSHAIVDIDSLADLAYNYDIKAIPAVLAIKDGQVIIKITSYNEYDKKINLHYI